MPFLIDSHAHLEMGQFKADLEQVLERANESNVTHIITVGSTLAESRRALKIAEKYDEVSAVVGVHPHDAADVDEKTISELEKLARKRRVVGIGETGLDFFRDRSPRSVQEKAFRLHLALAEETGLPREPWKSCARKPSLEKGVLCTVFPGPQRMQPLFLNSAYTFLSPAP
jgi:TatD DNase family protein